MNELNRSAEISLRADISRMESQFQAALPAHIPLERFMRVVNTAIGEDQNLLLADRRSLLNAAVRAAQDGLLPDKREGAFVIFKSKVKDANGQERWIEKVQWMPMVFGIRKKVRNSKEIIEWNVQVVHQRDHFEYELGDDPYIKHKPYLGEEDPGPMIAAYSVATFRSGEKSREVMSRGQIEKIRLISKSPDKGPWKDWYEEMCRKTVARRHSKILPMSTDLDDLLRQDDELYDYAGARERAKDITPERPKLSQFTDETPKTNGKPKTVSEPVEDEVPHDEETGEIEEEGPSLKDAMEMGREARKGLAKRTDSPAEFNDPQNEPMLDAWLQGYDEKDFEIKQKLRGNK